MNTQDKIDRGRVAMDYVGVIEEKEKETNSTKQNSRVSTDKNTPARGKTNTFAEANRYYQSLTERGKDAFDIGALKLSRSDEANPGRGGSRSGRLLLCAPGP